MQAGGDVFSGVDVGISFWVCSARARKTFSSLLSMPCLCSEAKPLPARALGHLGPAFLLASQSLPGATAGLLQARCAAMPSARGTDRMSWSRYCQRQSCDPDGIHCQGVEAEVSTAGLQGQHPPSTATVQIKTQSVKPVRQFKGTVMSVCYFSNG